MGYKTPRFERSDKYHAEWWSFRHLDRRDGTSFVHSAALVAPDGHILLRANCRYSNRTWECYPGDTVRRKLAELIEKSMFAVSDEHLAQIRALKESLSKSDPVEPVSYSRGTRIGYSLAMCCPM